MPSVAVEKLFPAKFAKMKLCQDALKRQLAPKWILPVTLVSPPPLRRKRFKLPRLKLLQLPLLRFPLSLLWLQWRLLLPYAWRHRLTPPLVGRFARSTQDNSHLVPRSMLAATPVHDYGL
jgi:hypothetical protein